MCLKRAIVLTLTATITACGTAPDVQTPGIDRFVAQQTAFVQDEIADVAGEPGALATYAGPSVQVIGFDPKLDTLVAARWNGTAEGLTKTLARTFGYATAARGEKLPAPLYVVINGDHLTARGMLEQAFSQTRDRATLTIDATRRVMEVTYKRLEASPIPHQDDRQL